MKQAIFHFMKRKMKSKITKRKKKAKISRQKNILKTFTEIKEIENRKIIESITKAKNSFFKNKREGSNK